MSFSAIILVMTFQIFFFEGVCFIGINLRLQHLQRIINDWSISITKNNNHGVEKKKRGKKGSKVNCHCKATMGTAGETARDNPSKNMTFQIWEVIVYKAFLSCLPCAEVSWFIAASQRNVNARREDIMLKRMNRMKYMNSCDKLWWYIQWRIQRGATGTPPPPEFSASMFFFRFVSDCLNNKAQIAALESI